VNHRLDISASPLTRRRNQENDSRELNADEIEVAVAGYAQGVPSRTWRLRSASTTIARFKDTHGVMTYRVGLVCYFLGFLAFLGVFFD
jgi:hypothetical protein